MSTKRSSTESKKRPSKPTKPTIAQLQAELARAQERANAREIDIAKYAREDDAKIQRLTEELAFAQENNQATIDAIRRAAATLCEARHELRSEPDFDRCGQAAQSLDDLADYLGQAHVYATGAHVHTARVREAGAAAMRNIELVGGVGR